MGDITTLLADAIIGSISRNSYTLGRSVAVKPWWWIKASSLVSLLLSACVLLTNQENRTERLYVPAGVESFKRMEMGDALFGNGDRNEVMVIEPKSGVNVMTADAMAEASQLHTRILYTMKDADGNGYSDVCARPFEGAEECKSASPLSVIFNDNVTVIRDTATAAGAAKFKEQLTQVRAAAAAASCCCCCWWWWWWWWLSCCSC